MQVGGLHASLIMIAADLGRFLFKREEEHLFQADVWKFDSLKLVGRRGELAKKLADAKTVLSRQTML